MKDYEQLKLSNQLCFPLYAASKEIVRKYKQYLDQINLTYTQYITMMVMWEYKELNVKEIGEKLYLDSGTLTPVLKQLESKGFIKRERDTKDERNLVVSITKEGEALKKEASDIPTKMSNCFNLDKEEVEVLYKILYKIIESVNETD